ncbi:MAG: hypothetical protein NDJ94_20975 [Vicinamibacteria bacterium]|nr:hypothetical protein [Vicinamibacteria bacterium]
MRAASVGLALALLFAPAAAGEGLSVSFDAGWSDLTSASKSAKAVFGESGGGTFGAAIRKPLGDDFFVELGARVFRKEGERVFVADRTSAVFPLGHPLELRLIPIQATFSYRLGRVLGLDTYIGLGGGVALYEETSSVAGVAEPDLSKTSATGHAVLGADRWFGRVRLGLALSYAIVPSTLGAGGVSKIYEEEDAGGFTALVKIGFGSGRKSSPPPTSPPVP